MTEDIAALVVRLRQFIWSEMLLPLLKDAADALEHQVREIERLRREIVDSLREEAMDWNEIILEVQGALGSHAIPPMNFGTAIHTLRTRADDAERELADTLDHFDDLLKEMLEP